MAASDCTSSNFGCLTSTLKPTDVGSRRKADSKVKKESWRVAREGDSAAECEQATTSDCTNGVLLKP